MIIADSEISLLAVVDTGAEVNFVGGYGIEERMQSDAESSQRTYRTSNLLRGVTDLICTPDDRHCAIMRAAIIPRVRGNSRHAVLTQYEGLVHIFS